MKLLQEKRLDPDLIGTNRCLRKQEFMHVQFAA
jgi:hypothetical protein